jgi:Xaa-Pro aminopeptidase
MAEGGMTRIERLRGSLEEPLLVTAPVNVRYLTGFESSNAAVLVEPDRTRLFTDFRYAERARDVPEVEFVETKRAVVTDLAALLDGRIGFEAPALSYAAYASLSGGGLDLVPRYGLVEEMRRVKEEPELDAIRRAAEITDRAYEALAQERFTGRTERELAWRMEELLHELGADGAAFDILVAGGVSGSSPHSEVGGRKIRAGETVIVDAGCKVGGYLSDCTRTFATGPISDELKEAYAVCLQAQEAGLAAVRAGAVGRDVDAVAREIVDGTQFRDAFGHGLGHGVGLLVHEDPRLSQVSDDVLEPGNVVTVEPGIYLSGRGGIRIEDLVVVTGNGAEVLTQFTKDLVTVD